MDYLLILVPSIFISLVLLFLIVFHFKKKSVIRKVNSLNITEKKETLDNLAEAVGYCYDPCQDIFIARQDAPQKIFGYTTFYDLSAPYFNMVFDYETIYFDYNARTWLIEMWKGQYGINSGCELGIYYADKIISPKDYSSTHFQSVESKDMLELSLELNRYSDRAHSQSSNLGNLRNKHWWLTIFKMGIFTKPQNLFVDTSIRFKDYSMMYTFLNSFEKTLPAVPFRVDGLTVHFTFDHSSRHYSFFKRMVRTLALTTCRIYCKWFLYLTRPFTSSGDKLLYLYYYLPFVIRNIFKPKKIK